MLGSVNGCPIICQWNDWNALSTPVVSFQRMQMNDVTLRPVALWAIHCVIRPLNNAISLSQVFLVDSNCAVRFQLILMLKSMYWRASGDVKFSTFCTYFLPHTYFCCSHLEILMLFFSIFLSSYRIVFTLNPIQWCDIISFFR